MRGDLRNFGMILSAHAPIAHLAALVALAVLSPTTTLAQTGEGTEPTPAEPVQVAPTVPPLPPPPVSEPNEMSPPSAPLSATTDPPSPAQPSPGEAAPAPLPTRTEPPTPPAPRSAAPIAQPGPGQKVGKGGSARQRDAPRPASTLTIVNGRAIAATSVAVLVGRKVVARSGPLASNARVTLKLPGLKACQVFVVAKFPLWYSALRSGAVNVCKADVGFVRL